MSNQIGKDRLLKWLEMQREGDLQEWEFDRASALLGVIQEIESGRFDLFDTLEEEQPND